MKTVLYLMMGGSGTRLGANIPKQFIEISGKPIYEHIIDLYSRSGLINLLVIVCKEEWINTVKKHLENYEANFHINVISGGKSRSESIKNAVIYTKENLKIEDADRILIHDTTHPYLDCNNTKLLIEKLDQGFNAATLVTHVWDTVYTCEDNRVCETLKRENIGVGASPEGFKWKFLSDIYLNSNQEIARFTSAVDLAQSQCIEIGIIWSSLINLKITYPDDLSVFEIATKYFLKN